MKKIFGDPSRYAGVWSTRRCRKYARILGNKPAIIIDPDIAEMIKIVDKSFDGDKDAYYVKILGKNSPSMLPGNNRPPRGENGNAAV